MYIDITKIYVWRFSWGEKKESGDKWEQCGGGEKCDQKGLDRKMKSSVEKAVASSQVGDILFRAKYVDELVLISFYVSFHYFHTGTH